MDLAESLRRIRLCVMERPYVFISYSSRDRERVWEDVLEFQKRGYNVWLDDKNVDKSKPSWKDDAIRAVQGANCRLVVFYVSRSSLSSVPCYNEMCATRSPEAKSLHNGEVKFIAVDVEPIDNIVSFADDVYDELRDDFDIDTGAREARLNAVFQFKQDFFGGNNERVRVHAKNVPDRTADYYDEIVEYFPKKTQIEFPPSPPSQPPPPPQPVPPVQPVQPVPPVPSPPPGLAESIKSFLKKHKRLLLILGVALIAVAAAVAVIVRISSHGAGGSALRGNYEVGDILTFGTYEQDNDESNGQEPIDWLVLAAEDDRILVISQTALDFQPYQPNDIPVTWQYCSLRTWLNNTFYDAAFSTEDKSRIQNATVTADANPGFHYDSGNDTTDKVFLLSIQEADTYFSSPEARQCRPTAFATARGASIDADGFCCWWLRTKGGHLLCAGSVRVDGSVSNYGDYVYLSTKCAVRPAMWITVKASAGKDDAEKTESKAAEANAGDAALSGSYSVGDTLTFGTYEQDNDESNGKEPIEWQVLAKESDRILVISRYGLDRKKYNETCASVTWETCTLRNWLNGTFLNDAFSSDEQRQIADSTVTADKNPTYDTDPGNDTTDKIFLLSIPEAEKYFGSDEERKCRATAYAEAEGVWTYGTTGFCWWCLRSPGYHDNYSSVVDCDGYQYDDGFNVDDSRVAVRPALWINVEDASGKNNTDQTESKAAEANAGDAALSGSYSVGDTLTFGTYEQDNDESNGKEPIEWQVLAKESDRILVISRYGLDQKVYNETSASVTWETCTLRSWLNDTFMNGAFSSDEQRKIADSTVTADNNPGYDTDPGNDTTDRIFLLSIPEAEQYFSSDKDWLCLPTPYAVAQGRV